MTRGRSSAAAAPGLVGANATAKPLSIVSRFWPPPVDASSHLFPDCFGDQRELEALMFPPWSSRRAPAKRSITPATKPQARPGRPGRAAESAHYRALRLRASRDADI